MISYDLEKVRFSLYNGCGIGTISYSLDSAAA
jgi:hypothetical protein